MRFSSYSCIPIEQKIIINSDFPLKIVKLKEKIKHFLKKNEFIIIFVILIILSNNFDLNFLSNGFIFSKKKKYHYFSKYFKNYSFIINNYTQLKTISLINEIIYLYNIRNEINMYKNINIKNIKIKKFSPFIHPKISLIITIYNQENYILKIYSCILNQSLENIEIIFMDDNSTDNSSQIINKLMKSDKRIIYMKNKLNKGQFYSRNKAVLSSRGKYILIIDPDDFLLNNILIKCYKVANKFNLDILQFYHVMGNYSQNHLYILNKNSEPIHRPKTATVFFNNPTRYLWDKLIKKKIFVKSIYFMHEKFRKERFIIHNDETVCFGLFKTAYSYAQIEEVGYFYNRNISNSTTTKNFLPESLNGRFHSIFATMKYYYEQSANNSYEKFYGGYKFFTYRIIRKYEDKIQFLTEGFDFIEKVIDLYLKCPFFNNGQKVILKQFKYKIKKQKLKNLHQFIL